MSPTTIAFHLREFNVGHDNTLQKHIHAKHVFRRRYPLQTLCHYHLTFDSPILQHLFLSTLRAMRQKPYLLSRQARCRVHQLLLKQTTTVTPALFPIPRNESESNRRAKLLGLTSLWRSSNLQVLKLWTSDPAQLADREVVFQDLCLRLLLFRGSTLHRCLVLKATITTTLHHRSLRGRMNLFSFHHLRCLLQTRNFFVLRVLASKIWMNRSWQTCLKVKAKK